MLWHLAVNVVGASSLMPARWRRRLYALCGIRSRTDWILGGCVFATAQAEVGSNSWVNHRCRFDNAAPVVIGNGCDLGMEVLLAASNGPIRIEDGCWIGTRAVILGGVTVGTGCIVASGAVVESDCEPHGVYAGVPATRVRDLRDDAGP
jgi:maltose O-acetyltransferase